MKRSMLNRFFPLATLFILISACAKISVPSGGPKDKMPPVVIKSIPDNGAKNFRNKKLAITFNEYVVLDNINEKFMVSPPMKMKPRVFTKGKSVLVEFDDKLKDSTTYTFYFQDAIKDLNEGNIIENFQFVFSTGPVIDSLSITGNVFSSYNLEVPEKTQVLMYQELADSAVVKHLPDYISRVDQNGYFRIDNVRAGNYRLYALKDVDNSKNYNLTEEEFAFMNSDIEITPEKNFIPGVKDTATVKKVVDKVPEPAIVNGEYQLMLFAAQKKDHYLTNSARNLKYQMIYTLSLPPDSMKFEFSIPGAVDDTYFIEKSRNNDTLKVWLADSALYLQPQITTIVKYPLTDTVGTLGYKEDTILMRFLAPRAPRAAKVKKPVFTVDANIITGSLKPGQSIVFSSQTPFRQPDTSRIYLYELIDTTRQKIRLHLVKDSTNSCKYTLTAKLLQGRKYLFIADSASFGNIYSENSDSTGIKFSVRDTESYSKLTLNISNYEGARIIQLLNNMEKLVSESLMKNDGKLVFPLLENGFYRVRVIYDLNSDGKWTTGDFTSGRQPEPVSYYPDEIEIKTGWEIEQDWDMGVENVKDQKLRENKKTR
ncbi:MAG: Ig-like domain-containing domain [Bacteroidia bacterium]|nr:Ig-like domain-containing domain [Bacteroidia bacterium]